MGDDDPELLGIGLLCCSLDYVLPAFIPFLNSHDWAREDGQSKPDLLDRTGSLYHETISACPHWLPRSSDGAGSPLHLMFLEEPLSALASGKG